ncbi:MAG TPA: hypothetical protein VIT45_12735 [Allosphingosinicella sp.]
MEVWFLSGATPAWLENHLSNRSLSLLGDDSIFLTLGAFSLIVISYFEEVSEEIQSICTRYRIATETWVAREEPLRTSKFEEINGDEIRTTNPAEHTIIGSKKRRPFSSSLLDNASIQAEDPLGIMTLELYALLSVINSRSIGPLEVFSDDAAEVELVVNKLITDSPGSNPHDGDDVSDLDLPATEPQELLLTLNAALSRLCSQALAGTTPIMQTECHFWPHSFLGIGVANLALRNVADFVTQLVVEANYHQRYKILFDSKFDISSDWINPIPRGLPSYLDLRPKAIAGLPGHAAADVSRLIPHPASKFAAPTPITYFSGRDGFTNNALTVSAPLPSVSGCDSYKWNLGTITHELSHRVVSGKLQNIFRDLLERFALQDITNIDSLLDWFDDPPTSIAGYAEKLVGFSLLSVHAADFKDGELRKNTQFSTFEFFKDAKELYSVQIEETLVHIFDFYHFYGSDPRVYMDFVWLSWAVQPSIARKTDDYIRRTVTALSISHLLSENWRERAVEDFLSGLNSEPLASGLSFSKDLIDALSEPSCRTAYEHHLEVMQPIIILFHLLFKSEDLRESARKEEFRSPEMRRSRGPAGRSTNRPFNYSARSGTFSTGDPSIPAISYSNPLVFLRDYSRQASPNAANSAWLLHMLAFNRSETNNTDERLR